MITPGAKPSLLARIGLSTASLLRIWLLALIGATLLLALVNLPYSPRTWFDEGSHLHVPKTIVQHGVYADISSEGFRYYGPTVGVGPTVMLPIALVFKLFGVQLLYGRLVIVGYLLLALTAFLLLARRMHGQATGLLALTLLLASRTLARDGMLEYGRQVLGEVPGMAFLFLGALAWVASLSADQRRPALAWGLPTLAGLGFGLALVTKNQFVLIIPPTLLLLALLDWRYYRAGTWRLRLIPPIIAVGCFGLWTLAQLQFLGPGSFAENLAQTRQAAGGSIFVFDRSATLRAGAYLLRPDLYGGLLIPSLAYALWRARRRDAQGLAEALVATLITLWLAWFVGASLGWPRYAFPAVAFGALTVARALADLIGWLLRPSASAQTPLDARLGWLQHASWPVALVGAYSVLLIAMPLTLTARQVLHHDDSAQRMAAYLNANLPTDTLIETWEPELGVLTDHRYHYPPIKLLDTAVRHQWLGGPPLTYDGLVDAPPYLVIGGFGDYTNIYYNAGTLDRDYVTIYRADPYVLYKHR